jgi:hypothetical protein
MTKGVDIVGVATAHPAMVDKESVRGLKVPLCLLPSQDEPNMTDVIDVITENNKSIGDLCVHKRFDDMHHGFIWIYVCAI